MANTIGLMGVPSLCTLGRPYICGNPVLHLHCGVTSQGPVLVITEGLYHSVSIVGFVHYHSSSAFVSRNDDDVGVILQAVECIALLKGQVRFWWLGLL